LINLNLTIERKHIYVLAGLVAGLALLIPGAALASHAFGDVPDSNVFHDDISWVKDAGITLGCGDGTNYCPESSVTRGQMAAFLRRTAENQVVDAKEVNGGTAYMWASLANSTVGAAQTADSTYSYNSEGGAITYTRTGTGAYTVTVPGWGTGGNVQVTTYATAGVNCQTSGWSSGVSIGVRCYDSAGSAADSRFTVAVLGN
jgi:hypothetical protein